jgi:glycine betaine/proline transport system substrate-binding protein
MKPPRHLIVTLPLALVGASLLAAAAQAGPKIVLAEMNWDEPRAVNAVLRQILTERFDADVEEIAADQAVIFSAMALGDGSIDVHSAIWSGARQADIDRYVTQDGTVQLNERPYFAEDGFYLPRAFAEANDIVGVEDLLDPEIAKLLDVNGDGRGDYWPGAPGWAVANIHTVKAKSYGFNEFYDPLIASDALMKAQLESSYARGDGILFYYWTPEALQLQFDLLKLKEPDFDGYAMAEMKGQPEYNPEGCYNYVDPTTDPDWLEKSDIRCSAPPNPIHIGYSTALSERAPEVAAFLSNVAITQEEIGGWLYEMSVNKKDPAAVASEWIAAHPERVAEWLDTPN